jgi:HEAT repeat protein
MSAIWLLLACTLADAPAAPAGLAPITADYAMDSDPVLPAQKINKAYSAKYLPLWLQALDRPEADFQRLAAETVAQAHIEGMPKMIAAKPALVRIVSAKETHPAARFAAARALIALEARDAAPPLFQVAQENGANLRQLIEPALALWKYEPAYDAWRKRLTSAEVNHRDLMLAVRCLGDAGDQTAMPQLLAIMGAAQRLDAERLAAARAAGQLQGAELESNAGKLARANAPIIDRLCAASLLERHASEPAKTLLLALAADPEPSVATAALRRLNAIDTSLVLPLVEKALQSPDSGVRRLGAAAYAVHPTLERIKVLGKHLDDPHPQVRRMVREEFRRLAGDSQWDGPIRQSATEALEAESWRGQEQAALLLGALDHKPAAPRLITLLDSPRGEVMIATAWALRKLSLPETLPALFKKASYLTDVRLRQRNFDELDYQGAHLFEALGRMNYKPAEPLMRRYIPKNYVMGEYSRSAAIWSLGLLHAGKPDEALAAQITGRVTEPAVAMPPEMSRVRLAGTIALGKMKAKSQAKPLRDYLLQAGESQLYMAIRWSLHEINGEELPPPPPATISKGGWFLGPLDISETPEP